MGVCAIDGYSASGKSTLAHQIAKDLLGIQVVPLDDFFLTAERRRPSVYAKNYDLDRLQMQVLEPLLEGREVRYQPFDWGNMALSRDFITIPKNSKVIVEGTYSLDIKLRHAFDFSIWVDTPESVRMTRMMDRGLSHAEASKQHNPEELLYAAAMEPRIYADLTVKGAAAFPETAEILRTLEEVLKA